MECPKCGYERQSSDMHCTLCGLDYEFYENQQAETKALKERSRKPVDNGAIQEAPTQAPPSRMKSVASIGKCPKCGFSRKEGNTDCPKCGVVYEKHEEMLALKDAEKKEAKEKEANRLQEEKARRQKEAADAIAKQKAKRERDTITGEREVLPSKDVSTGKYIKYAVIGLVSVLLIVGTIFLVKIQIEAHREKAERQREIALQEEVARKKAEEEARFVNEFFANKDRIINEIKVLIDKRQYKSAQKELEKYDIPQIEGELSAVKLYFDEMKLLTQAKKLPGSRYEDNYKIYLKLSKINPKNKKYKKKTNYYGAKYREKKAEDKYKEARSYFKIKKPYRSDLKEAIAAIDEAIKLGKRKKIYKNLKRKLERATLGFYEGNDKVKMKIQDQGIISGGSLSGQRKMRVGIKNVSNESFYVNVEYFTLIGTNNKKYKYNTCSKGLVKNLKPGKEAKGYIYFYTSARPKKLVFSHISAGTISRVF